MLQVILFILKLVGWILLVILGLLVLVLLAVVFTPLRYQAEVSCPGRLSELEADVGFGIFFRLISGSLQYREGNLSWKIRAAWMKLGDTGEAEEEIEEAAGCLEEIGEGVLEGIAEEEEAVQETGLEKPAEETEDTGEEPAEKSEDTREEPAEKSEDTGEERREEPAEKSEDTREERREEPAEETADPEDLKTEEEKVNPELPDIEKKEPDAVGDAAEEEAKKETKAESKTDPNRKSKKTFLDKIGSVFEKIEYTFDRMCAKIRMLSAKAELVTAFLSDDVHQSAFLKLLAELKKMAVRLQPKQFRGTVRFGFEDPSLTGKVLAGVSMLYPYWGEHVFCCPDFEGQVLEGELFIKGSLRLLPAAVCGWNLLWSRNVRRTILDAKRLISKLRK